MIKKIKTAKFEGMAVLVPDDVIYMDLYRGRILCFESKLSGGFDEINLPEGKYEILGKSTELTEEQCAEIMPKPVAVIASDGTQIGTNYLTESAKADFDQHMRYVVGAHSVNPYMHPCNFNVRDDDKYDELFFQWQEAQANTGTWVILRRL